MADLPSLADAPWLAEPAVSTIFAALAQSGDEVRIVGGAVRNALLGLPVREIDFATTALPEVVVARAEAAGLKVVPTGLAHGTVTIVADGRGYEVTTLREDVETDGRHAVVRFGRDWALDARRRDFTVNALSVDAEGRVYDPVGGRGDLRARRIRFIGDADRRIAEDRLRILRFFRFHAEIGAGPIDGEGLSAAIRGRAGVRELSAERLGREMRRLVAARGAADAVAITQEAGILPIVIAGVGHLLPFRRLVAFEDERGDGPDAVVSPARRLAVLGCRVAEDVLRLTARLALSNAERDRMLNGLAAADEVRRTGPREAGRWLLYQRGETAFRDGLAIAAATGGDAGLPAWRALGRRAEEWRMPRFPIRGSDVVAAGIPPGRSVGSVLRKLEAWWTENDFRPGEAELRERLRAIAAERGPDD